MFIFPPRGHFELVKRPCSEYGRTAYEFIDVYAFCSRAFDTTSKLDCSLRSIFESASIPKVFFDVRNDSNALFSHYQISLAGVVDLQVMEYGTRKSS